MRAANVVLQWMKLDFYSIDTSVLASIEHFAEKNLKKDKFAELSVWIAKELAQPVRFNLAVVDNLVFQDLFSVRKIKDKEIPKQIIMFELNALSPSDCLLLYDRQTVAEQLTLIEFELYSNIRRTYVKFLLIKINVDVSTGN